MIREHQKKRKEWDDIINIETRNTDKIMDESEALDELLGILSTLLSTTKEIPVKLQDHEEILAEISTDMQDLSDNIKNAKDLIRTKMNCTICV